MSVVLSTEELGSHLENSPGFLLHLFLSFQFLKLFDELVQGMEAILAAGHMGVIVQLAESCAESGERQTELMQCLLHVSMTEYSF